MHQSRRLARRVEKGGRAAVVETSAETLHNVGGDSSDLLSINHHSCSVPNGKGGFRDSRGPEQWRIRHGKCYWMIPIIYKKQQCKNWLWEEIWVIWYFENQDKNTHIAESLGPSLNIPNQVNQSKKIQVLRTYFMLIKISVSRIHEWEKNKFQKIDISVIKWRNSKHSTSGNWQKTL